MKHTESVSILGLLGIAFIVLKLCHIINWSWWWVTVPFWGVLVIALGTMVIIGISWLGFLGTVFVVEWIQNKKFFTKKEEK